VSLDEVEELNSVMPRTGGTYGTDFSAAFLQCEQEVRNEADPGRLCHLIFMTDGDGGDPTSVVRAMISKHRSKIARYDCIPFGAEAQQARPAKNLKAVENLFKEANIITRTMSSDDAQELAESFASCGTDDILQMPRAKS
jgi:hypothetical protein